MIFTPKVSIVVPVYNGANYLREAIDSALAQTYKNFEIIVVNDGSCDGGKTEEIALSYGNQIRYFSKENGGVSTALNLGIKEMQGEYFSWLSHDDIYLPDKLETQINYLRTCPEEQRDRIILYNDFYIIDAQSKIVSERRIPSFPEEQLPYQAMLNFVFNGCAMLIPKRCFEETGLFNEKLKYIHDYQKFFGWYGKYHFFHVPEMAVKFRFHELSHGGRAKEGVIQESNKFYIWGFDHFVKNLSAPQKQAMGFSYLQLAKNFKGRNLTRAAIHVLNAAPIKLWRDKLWGYCYCYLIDSDEVRNFYSFVKRALQQVQTQS